MKRIAFAWLSIVAFADVFSATAQGTFQNLDFEQAQVSGPPPQVLPISQALPGWQVSLNGSSATTLLYDNFNLNLWAVSIHDGKGNFGFPPISGRYSIFLQSGTDQRGTPGYAEISQIGSLPADMHSLLFAATKDQVALNVSFNGQPLQTTALQDHGAYQTFGADISAFAGQTGELSFMAAYPAGALIDDIQFSTTSIPEPSTLAMFAIGCGVLLRIKRKL